MNEKKSLKCPSCDHPKTRVMETRTTPELIYRTRKCVSCGWMVTTHETYADDGRIPNSIRRPSK